MIPPPTPEDMNRDAEREYETNGLATGWCGNPELLSWIRLCVAARASAMVSDTRREWLQAENERLQSLRHRDAELLDGVQAELERLRAELDKAVKPLLSEGDLIKFYGERMLEHRNNAVAGRKRAEAAEAEVERLQAENGKLNLERAVMIADGAELPTLRDERDQAEAEVHQLRAAIKLAIHRGPGLWYEVSEADVDGWVAAAAERREAAK